MTIRWIGTPNHTPGRGGQAVDHITLHIMAGTLAGTDAHFANPASQVSATYGIGADGTIHQYVSENDTAWADANGLSNQTGISIEHQGGLSSIPCTRQCMDASAELCADIARRYGWGKLVHNGISGNVYLHREIPGSTHATCPDLAPNGLDVNYVINKANEILNGTTKEENMPLTNNDINAIKHAVWEYVWENDKDRTNMYNFVRAKLPKMIRDIAEEVWEQKVNGTRAMDRLTGIDAAANAVRNKERSAGLNAMLDDKTIDAIADRIIAKLGKPRHAER